MDLVNVVHPVMNHTAAMMLGSVKAERDSDIEHGNYTP